MRAVRVEGRGRGTGGTRSLLPPTHLRAVGMTIMDPTQSAQTLGAKYHTHAPITSQAIVDSAGTPPPNPRQAHKPCARDLMPTHLHDCHVEQRPLVPRLGPAGSMLGCGAQGRQHIGNRASIQVLQIECREVMQGGNGKGGRQEREVRQKVGRDVSALAIVPEGGNAGKEVGKGVCGG